MTVTDVSTETTTATVDKSALTLVLERTFNAPRELVFKAFSDAEMLTKWWGPREWPATVKNIDFRVGGSWLYCMTGPDGTEAWGKGAYEEIVPPEKIVWRDIFTDSEGNDNTEMPSMVATFNFIDLGGNKTKLSSVTEFASAEDLEQLAEMGMVQGWSESLDKLEELLAA